MCLRGRPRGQGRPRGLHLCKFSGQEFEEIHRNVESSETPKQVRIPPITK